MSYKSINQNGGFIIQPLQNYSQLSVVENVVSTTNTSSDSELIITNIGNSTSSALYLQVSNPYLIQETFTFNGVSYTLNPGANVIIPLPALVAGSSVTYIFSTTDNLPFSLSSSGPTFSGVLYTQVPITVTNNNSVISGSTVGTLTIASSLVNSYNTQGLNIVFTQSSGSAKTAVFTFNGQQYSLTPGQSTSPIPLIDLAPGGSDVYGYQINNYYYYTIDGGVSYSVSAVNSPAVTGSLE
jgi:hypothetical protein